MVQFNPNELIIEKVREVVARDLDNGSIRCRATQIEDANLNITAESEAVVDAVGATIDTIYRAKAATLELTNSLFSLDLMAMQMGAKKVLATEEAKQKASYAEVLEITGNKITLKYTPVGEIKYVYKYVANNIAERLDVVSAEPTESQFTISGKDITFNEAVTGKVYVIYDYESTSAAKVSNKADAFPDAVRLTMFVVLREPCNTNRKYYGIIEAAKAKADPSSITLALTTTGKHSVSFQIQKDYCSDDGELFNVIVPQ